MKHARTIVSALAIASLLCGCTKQSANLAGSNGGRNPWTIPGEVRVGNVDEPDSLNPMFAHTDAADQVDGLLFSSWLRYDDDGNYIPDLATVVPSYENGGISKDGKTLTFHMRHGVKWSDGAPLTVKDWLFTYHAVLNPLNNTKTKYGWDEIASVDTPDPYTLIVHMKVVDAGILGEFATGRAAYPPLPAHLLASLPNLNRASFNSHPISSGPFLLKQWNHGSSLVFTANPLYFRGRPKLNEIVWKIIPNVNTLFAQLQTHDVDVYIGVDENHVAGLAQLPGVTVTKKLIANWRHMGINTSRPQLSDVRVRLALIEAIDWNLINRKVYHGYNAPAVSDVYPNLWAAPSIPPYPYDPQNARRLLAQAGWTMGSDGVLHKGPLAMRITISTNTEKQENEQAEVLVQAQLRPLGVSVSIHNYPTSLLFAQDGPLYTGKYDLEWSIETNAPDPDDRGLWNGKFIPPNGSNTVWLNDPIVNRLSQAAVETFDRAKRKALIQQEQSRLHELVPSQYIYWENEYTGANSDMKNLRPAAFVQDTWNAWEWSI